GRDDQQDRSRHRDDLRGPDEGRHQERARVRREDVQRPGVQEQARRLLPRSPRAALSFGSGVDRQAPPGGGSSRASGRGTGSSEPVPSDLRTLNLEIGRAERERDRAFLAEVLHDELVFRRANGSIASKVEYLDELERRTYEALEVDIAEIDEQAGSAVVTAIVTASGSADGTPFAGTFRNLRTVVADGDGWRCRLWV